MGILISKLLSLWGKEEHKVIIVGLDNAGKTTILYQFVSDEVVMTSPTIGSNVEEVKFQNTHFVMWDVGGQDSLRATWASYYAGASALILVVDCTDRERLPLVRTELYKMLAHEDLRGAHVLVYANKQDCQSALAPAALSAQLHLTSLKSHTWHVQPCCALTGEGLSAGLQWLTNQITGRKQAS
eukprot:m.225261 g.225261  ORF g.225261 m.225261 type:complete len:184 (+) comp11238_c0_seq1:73-624(+)